MSWLIKFKTYPKMIIRGIFVVLVLGIISTLLLKQSTTWEFIKMGLILVPSFLTGSIISEEYEKCYHGIVFTTKIALYKYLVERYLFSILFSELIIIFLYICAYIVGLEDNFIQLIYLVLSSFFISTLALTLSNITKKTLIGYGAAIGYFSLFMTISSSLNERLLPVSVMIGFIFKNKIFVENIATLIAASIILLLFNIWYAGRGERIRNKIGRFAITTVIASALILSSSWFIDYTNSNIQGRILKSGDTIFICNDSKLKEEVQNMGYTVKEDGTNIQELLQENDVVVIGSQGSLSGNTVVKVNGKMIQITKDGLEYDGVIYSDVKGFRIIEKVKGNYLTYIMISEDAGTSINANSLEILLKESRGNLLGVNNGKAILESNFIQGISKQMNYEDIHQRAILTGSNKIIDKGNAKLIFGDMTKEHAEELANIWEFTVAAGEKFLSKDIQYTFSLVQKQGDNLIYYPIPGMIFFENYRDGGEDRAKALSLAFIEENFTSKFEDRYIRNHGGEYIYRTFFYPVILEGMGRNYIDNNSIKYEGEEFENYQEKIKSIMSKGEDLSRFDIQYIVGYIFYFAKQQPDKFMSLINDIVSSEEKVTNTQLKTMMTTYYSKEDVEDIFDTLNIIEDKWKNYKVTRRVVAQ